MNPITAVTSPNPYPYYAKLARERPFYFDQELAMWAASGANVVSEVLSNPRCRVRPISEPIPRALQGSASGKIFGQLMRMNDGPLHGPPKDAVVEAISPDLAEQCHRSSRQLANSIVGKAAPHDVSRAARRLMFELPSSVIAELLGVEASSRIDVVTQVSAFVNGIAADASAEQRAVGDCAAESLLARFTRMLECPKTPGSLLTIFAAACESYGVPREVVAANAVGMLFQSYDATAGLIGNSFCYLKNNPSMAETLRSGPDQLEKFAGEVARIDPPIHNTRRFTAEPTIVAGMPLPAGVQILVVLAAATHHSHQGLTSEEVFLRVREEPCFAFGSSTHRCPGPSLARLMTAAAIGALLADRQLEALVVTGRFKPSPNVRVTLF